MSTPLRSHYKLSDEQYSKMVEEQRYMDGIPYANIVGYVMYVNICTHLNIVYVVSVVRWFMPNPRQSDYQVLKWIFNIWRDHLEKSWFIVEHDDALKLVP